MLYLCPATKADGAAGEIPGPREGSAFVTSQRLVLRDMTAGAVFYLHGRDGGGIVKNAVKLYWNVVDVGFLHYLCLEIIK